MTNDADYELWAAMMADEEPAAPAAPLTPQIINADPILEVAIEPVAMKPAVEPQIIEELLLISEAAQSTVDEPIRQSEFVPSVEDFSTDDELDFPTNLFKEPQTNSITVPEVPDALTGEIVTESGEVLKTGAIDLPLMNNTGSIPIITVVTETVDEEAINADMGDETTGGIPPIRARSVMNSSARVGVLPIKNRRSEGQTIMLATTSILLVTLGAAVLALYMLEIIR
jgi:hypothetical protein